VKLYIWENADFGAYHQNGTAVIYASSPEEAFDLLLTRVDYDYDRSKLKSNRKKLLKRGAYQEIEAALLGEACVLAYNYGCDC
jgi:hypothetical protein